MNDKPVQNVVDLLEVVEVPTTLEERLEIAAMVTRGLQTKIDLATGVAASYKLTIEERDATLQHLAKFNVRLARKLSECAGRSHAAKNEIILSVVSDLLGNAQTLMYPPPQDYDDIPF